MRRIVQQGMPQALAAIVLVACLAAPVSARPDHLGVVRHGERAPLAVTTAAVRGLAAEAGMTDLLAELERRTSDQRELEQFEWWSRQFVPDWSGDGLADDLAIHEVFTIDGATVGKTTATLRAAEGDTGDVLWTRRWKRDTGTIFVPMEARVGPRGVPGVVVAEVAGFSFETTRIDYRFTAFTGKGKRLWSRAFTSTLTGSWPVTFAATDYMVTAELFDGLRGKATDLLMASGTVVVPPTWSLQSGVINAFAIDGRDGGIVEHPVPEVGVGFVPFAGAMDDFDGDRLDDYVFVNERPNAVPGEDEGTAPVAVGTGVVAARRGTDGFPLWTGGGVDLSEHNATLNNLGDFIGTPEGDVFLETQEQLLGAGNETHTYLFEGEAGRLLWKRAGLWPYSPGDVGGDGGRDVLTMHYYAGDGFVATKVRAYTGRGQRLWQREYRTEHELQTCCSWLIHWGGGWGVGDYNRDRASDGYITHSAGGIGATELEDTFEHFVIDAASGRKLVEGGEELQALGRPPVDGGSSDYARVRWSAGGTRVDVYDGTTSGLLTSTELAFDVPLPPEKSYVYVESGRLDRDRCAEVAVSVYAPGGLFQVMLDGADGTILWGRSVGLREGSVRLAGATDSNDAC